MTRQPVMGLSPDALVATWSPVARELAGQVRRALLAAVPTFTEKALPGWRAVAFRDPQAGHVCALFALEDGVRLYFEHGNALDDPDGLFDARQRQTSYVTIRTKSDLRVAALKRMARRAVTHQSLSASTRRHR